MSQYEAIFGSSAPPAAPRQRSVIDARRPTYHLALSMEEAVVKRSSDLVRAVSELVGQ